MSVKTFLINLFLGCLTLVFVYLNLFAFYSPFSAPNDNNLPLVILDALLALSICAYNVVSAKNKGPCCSDIVVNRIVPLLLPFIIVLCILTIKGRGDRHLPSAIPKP